MCDEWTMADADRAAAGGIDRRGFALLGAGAVLAGCHGGARPAGGAGASETRETPVSVTTPDGLADAFFVRPVSGAHPGIVMWPDIAGLREAFRIMARRLAEQGYAVLCVNPYYRSAPAPVMESFSEYRTPEGQAKVAPMRDLLTPAAIASDAAAFVGFLDGDAAVDRNRGIGALGHCMSGPFTVRAAAAAPARVRAAASMHGAGLVTEGPDSPHLLIGKSQASFLLAIARNDDARSPKDKDVLRQAAADAGRPAEIEVYPADHGWTVPDSPAWDPNQADKAFHRQLALFAKL